ncbi:MAG: BfmA/BtgA family mobilization protein [Bacteroidota bacterium]
MAKKNRTYRFSAISIKDKVAARFRLFSKKMAKSHSETMTLMMDFFEWHGLDPSQKFVKSIIGEILKNRERTNTSIKRNEATIAIIRDIEINQTKPNNAMLLSLFGENLKDKKPVRKERKRIENVEGLATDIEITVPKIRYERLVEKMGNLTKDYGHILSNVELVKGSFGKEYLRLNISRSELEKFKRTLKNST